MDRGLKETFERKIPRNFLKVSRKELTACWKEGYFHPHIALNPKAPRWLLKELVKLYPYEVAFNPRSHRDPWIISQVLSSLEKAVSAPLWHPRSVEGDLLLYLWANKERLPKKGQKILQSIMDRAGLSPSES